MKSSGHRRSTLTIYIFFVLCGISGFIGLFALAFRPVDRRAFYGIDNEIGVTASGARSNAPNAYLSKPLGSIHEGSKSCATVEEMGEVSVGDFRNESLRVRRIIQNHFGIYGAPRIRDLPPEQFCKHGFVIGKASEAGFGNEMYKILTAAALSIMLNRSLIIGQNRGQYPFGDFISYSNLSFTLKEVKQLWRKNDCVRKYGRNLMVRVDNFEKPTMTNVLCGNWKEWEHPIIWLQGTTDAMAVQFFLKNIHTEMRKAASELFGRSGVLHLRPNMFGELMRFLICPSYSVEEAVNCVLHSQTDPHIALHMRMRMNRSFGAVRAALNCVKQAVHKLQVQKPRVVLVSDTPSLVRSIVPLLKEFAEVLHFDYEHFKGNISNYTIGSQVIDFRVRDWGPAPRWVAFVDFFLASRAKHAFISGAHRRVGTTYAQLIAALAAAQNLGMDGSLKGNQFSFFSSFQGNLLSNGLRDQVGWGHVWNRFAGPLSCPRQPDQCALTPLLPPAWWDGVWQSPLGHDIRRLETYGIRLSGFGTFDERRLQSYCNSKKHVVMTMPIAQM